MHVYCFAIMLALCQLPINFFQQWYVQYPNEGPWYELLVIPLRFELLCSIMIPISIKVTVNLSISSRHRIFFFPNVPLYVWSVILVLYYFFEEVTCPFSENGRVFLIIILKIIILLLSYFIFLFVRVTN